MSLTAPWSALPDQPLHNPPALSARSVAEQQPLVTSMEQAREAQRSLTRAGLNIVGELLRGEGPFYQLDHYPADDVFDAESHAQYYYHAHREAEHGHFHTFVRRPAIPPSIRPATGLVRSEPWPQGDAELAHLICISMDAWGNPQGLFAVNRWVTDESWYSAADTIALLDRFQIGHARPNLAINRWLTHFIAAHRPHIEQLLRHRDEVIARWQRVHPQVDVLEDRRLEITGYLPIDPHYWPTSDGPAKATDRQPAPSY